MAQWDQVKLRARADVHRTFARSAVYRATVDAVETVAINARRHTRQEVIGDLDREGYARVLQDVTALVFDLTEVTPARGGHVTFEAVGDQWIIDSLERSDDGRFQKANVTAHERA